MEHFTIIQALCRAAMADASPALRKQVERLRDALAKDGDTTRQDRRHADLDGAGLRLADRRGADQAGRGQGARTLQNLTTARAPRFGGRHGVYSRNSSCGL